MNTKDNKPLPSIEFFLETSETDEVLNDVQENVGPLDYRQIKALDGHEAILIFTAVISTVASVITIAEYIKNMHKKKGTVTLKKVVYIQDGERTHIEVDEISIENIEKLME